MLGGGTLNIAGGKLEIGSPIDEGGFAPWEAEGASNIPIGVKPERIVIINPNCIKMTQLLRR